ncbi:MAG: glycosyl transferase, partial [Candidatus Rokuibacteriota bacterium]
GERRADPGYYLISRGRPGFEQAIGYRGRLAQSLLGGYTSAGAPGYLGTIGLVTGLLLALPLLAAHAAGMSAVALALLGLAALIPASDLAIALVHRAITELLGPRPLPRLELRDGIPPALRTLVVMPTLLTTEAEVGEHIARLEIHHLANPDGAIHFALLSDWTDAPAETMPEDDRLLAVAVDGIADLNRRHGPAPEAGARFLMLHRGRAWSEGEGRWIGWERKRGKLDALTRLLRGADDGSFVATGGRPSALPAGVRYVITLDADTHLPRGAARRLVGTMAHPLNAPAFDARVGRVVEGYGVLQPRITPTMPADRDKSLFQRIYAGPAGVDPYAAAVSDVYQDLFGEGSYTGKGIFDVEAFGAALEGRVPENALLSHDLFEGIFARAGLVADIELFEDFPTDYEVAAARQHRWARGDWQLLPWLVRGDAAGIPLVARWKIIDNLRRTLSAPTAWLTLVGGWTLPHSPPLAWTAFVLATIALPALVPALGQVIPRRSGISKRTHTRAVLRSFALAGSQAALGAAFLAHQAWLMSDAVARTLVRLYVTRRRLLEWMTAAQAKSGLSVELSGAYRRLRGAPFLAATAGALVTVVRPESWAVAAPLVALWGLSPLVARWVSRPPAVSPTPLLSGPDVRVLRSTARRTWRFFETFVGPDDSGLPPDNFQEDPRPVVAHRTSPTNIGLSLLSTVAARDFGWIGSLETVERLEATLATLDRLERFRGHFYNWYDTGGLRPLEPRYVSTVDSGNLAGHLLALGNACRSALHRPLLDREAFGGIDDAVRLVQEAAAGVLADDRRTQTVTLRHLDEAREAVAAGLHEPPVSPAAWAARLRRLAVDAETLVDVAGTLTAERGDQGDAEVLVWARAVRAAVRSHERDLETFMPWAPHLETALAGRAAPAAVRTGEGLLSSAATPA